MNIMLNSVFFNTVSDEKIRILYLNPSEDYVIVISMGNNNRLPICIPYTELQNNINEGILIEKDEHIENSTNKLTAKQKETMEYQWSMIDELVNDIPNCYNNQFRAKYISNKCKEYNCTRMQLQKVLHKFWAGGMTKDALIPGFRSRGGKKGERTFTKQPGRPVVRENSNKRLIIAHFKAVINNLYNKDSRYSLNSTYKKMLSLYYTDKETNELLDAYPTFKQFQYHSRQYIDEREHTGEKRYDRNKRGLVGSSKSESDGPGEAYQIDATIADIYIVSRENRKQVVGRPVLYFVVDVFSRLIVGFYVGIEGPSWIGAMMALYYTFTSKVEICKRYGIHIKEKNWPVQGLPQSIICDNGEMISKNSENIINQLNIQVKNTVSWRPDMKGIIEQRFHLLNIDTKLYTPGSVYPDYQDRGAKDYRQDAVLNIDEFTKVIINYILMYNKKSLTKMPQETKDILEDGVKPIPLDIWNWGIKNRSGSLRKMSEEKIKQALLPSEKATVTSKGFHFNGKYYSTKTMITENWSAKSRSGGSWKIDIKYDPRDTDKILIIYDEGNCEWASQTNGIDEEFFGWYYEELLAYREERKNESSKMKENNMQLELDYHNDIEKIIKGAQKDIEKNSKNNVKNIRQAKEIEKNTLRRKEKFTPGDAKVLNISEKVKLSKNKDKPDIKSSSNDMFHNDSIYYNVSDLDDGEDW